MLATPVASPDTCSLENLESTTGATDSIIPRLETSVEITPQKEATEVYKFHLIVAALDEVSAEKYCEKLREKGHDKAHVIPYKKGLYRIAIASYAQRQQALDAMETLRSQNSSYAKAWVYCE